MAPPSESFSIKELLQRRVIVTLGKGGVGRTSVTTAIALVSAGRGKRTLVIETDPQRPIAASYGKKPGLEPIALQAHLWGLFLGGQESLEDYLGLVVPRPILRAVVATSLYQYFVNTAPALRELTMMGKIFHEIERRPPSKPPWDLIVVDAPASGQALAMIKMPFVAHETFGGVVSREAGEVAGFLGDPKKCAMILIATVEALAIAETLEIHRALAQFGLATTAVILNRAVAAGFEAGEITRMMRRATRDGRLKHPGDLADIARAALRRRNRERRALDIIHRQLAAPTFNLPERQGLSGLGLATVLAAELACYGGYRAAAASRS
jgi:anion-transporting  ArsA/GET3 family ATPase